MTTPQGLARADSEASRPRTIPGMLDWIAERFADHDAVVTESRTLTYAALRDEARRAAAALIAHDVRAGDRVAIWSPNTWHWVVAALATTYAGAVVVPLNTRYTASEATDILARTEAADPSPRGGPDTLYAVRGSGPPTSLGATDANTPVDTAVLSPDGSRLAFALYRSTGDACGTAAIVVSDADGTQQTYEVAASGADTASRVQRMWWQDGQPMSLSLTSWHCDPPGPSSPLVWQLGDGGLVAAEPRTVALQESELVPGQRAVLVPGSGTPPPDAGTLVIDDSGRRFPVEPNVDAFSVVPTSVVPTGP